MSQQSIDKWYFGFKCVKCSALVSIKEDESKGQENVQVKFSGRPDQAHFYKDCPECGHEAQYLLEQLKSYQDK